MRKNLKKSLDEQKKIYEADPVNEVKLLLEGDSTEDARILRGLSKNSQFSRIETLHGKKLEIEKLEEKYNGNVYTLDQIRELCIDYRLRFLQSSLYCGSFDAEVAAKIKQFAKETLIPTDEYTLGRRFYIMAPQEMFSLKEERYVSKAELRREQDPVIFYQLDNNHYRLIHKWGSDFTVFRLLSGFRWRSWWSHQMFNTTLIMPLVAFFYLLLFEAPAAHISNHPFIASLVISLTLALFIFGLSKQDEGGAIRGYFGKTNWDSESKIKR